MLPSRTTAWLFALPLLLLPAGVVYPAVRWLVLGYDGCLFALFLLDALLAARSRAALRVRRERPARLSVGVDNEVAIVLENIGTQLLSLVVRDEPPASFKAEPIEQS